MEGPTPVSALIHAATMVTAGIYFMLRFSIIFELTENIQNFIALIGAFTAFFGASVAAFQYDVKKIIAYSTCSQLGYMICVCGFGGYKFAFYHLIEHHQLLEQPYKLMVEFRIHYYNFGYDYCFCAL
jgi:NADH:ubiquinone oxidoreductase subunit 5 (subunit L)/multisubunit Na+/H+ antiporter MnhA subunit